MRRVYIMRGLPGCGKSTKARELVGSGGLIASTDDWFVGADGAYRYDPEKAGVAHAWNLRRYRAALEAGVPRIAVDNTNVKVEWFEPYLDAAKRFDYEVEVVNVETDLSDEELAARNTHGVPVEVIRRMREAFEEFNAVPVRSLLWARIGGGLMGATIPAAIVTRGWSVKNVLKGLRARGFDQSKYLRSSGSYSVRCSQCEALVINGLACHERGCPNKPRPQDEEVRA